MRQIKQKTLADVVQFSGVGAHSGVNATVKVAPACAGTGIVFIRSDLDEIIKGNYKNVSDTRMCTVITNKNGASVSTIEHIMSALSVFGIDNAIVYVNGPELPILDGSALEYSRKFRECGLKTLDANKRYIKVSRETSVEIEGKRISIAPASKLSIDATIDFAHPKIGLQRLQYTVDETSYINNIAPARTFAFERDLKQLQAIGLAKGAKLEHGIGLSEDGVLNAEGLRFSDEFVRHKILDVIGDLALGGNLLCRVTGYKMGHALNNAILHSLFSDSTNYEIIDGSEDVAIAPLTTPARGNQAELAHAF